MKARPAIYLIAVCLLLSDSLAANAMHCRNSQPCGNSCISWSKTCGQGGGSYAPSTPSFYRAALSSMPSSAVSASPTAASAERPTTYVVIEDRVKAYMSPNSSDITGVYHRGDTVLVYRVCGEWALLTDAPPHKWVKVSALQKK